MHKITSPMSYFADYVAEFQDDVEIVTTRRTFETYVIIRNGGDFEVIAYQLNGINDGGDFAHCACTLHDTLDEAIMAVAERLKAPPLFS